MRRACIARATGAIVVAVISALLFVGVPAAHAEEAYGGSTTIGIAKSAESGKAAHVPRTAGASLPATGSSMPGALLVGSCLVIVVSGAFVVGARIRAGKRDRHER